MKNLRSALKADHSAVAIAMLYVAAGVLWVTVSDSLLSWVLGKPLHREYIDLANELVLVVITGGMLFLLLRFRKKNHLAENLHAQVQESRMLKHFYDQPFVGMIITSPAGEILQVNDCICRMLGYSRKELGRKNWLEVVHPEDRRKRSEILERFAAGQSEAISIAIRYRHHDGSTIFGHANSHCVRKPNGEIDFLVTTLLDVTKLRQAEDKADMQATLLLQMARVAKIGGWSLNLQTNELFWSEEVYLLHEIEPGAPLKLEQGFDFYAPEARPVIEAAVRAAIDEGAAYDLELPLITAKGRQLWVRAQGMAIREAGKTTMICGAFQDITERKQRDRQARQLFQAVEQSPVSIVITDRRANIEYVNPAFTEITGYSREEILGRNPRILSSGRHPPEFFERLWRNLLAGREWRGVMHNKKKNGELFWERATISPIFDERNEISHFLAVKEDITEREQATRALAAHQAQLEETVRARTAELSEALEAALLADRAKDEFLANVSHELRTPLNVVIGLADLALRITHDAKQRDYLEKITGAGKNLATIINDLLDLSKIAAGHLEFESTAFSLRQLVTKSRLAMAHKAEEKNLMLEESVDPEVPEIVIGDPVRVDQILANLLSNAVKFTASGRIDIRVALAGRENDRVGIDIEVEDTGIGMSGADMEHLFKPFSQADSSISRRYGGTGLGLTISKRLAEMMAGDIRVVSREGQGSIFSLRIWLGLRNGEERSAPGEEVGTDFTGIKYRNVRVLVVDDQPLNLEIAEELLAAVGIDTRVATNGKEALERLAEEAADTYDLVLMDIQMPVMDGLAATRAIRQLGGFEEVPVIAMTAHTMEHEKRVSAAAGINDHIGKPFDIPDFYRKLAKWIPRIKQQAGGDAEEEAEIVNGFPAIHGLDTEAGLSRFSGKAERYRHWLWTFADEAPQFVPKVRQQLVMGDTATALPAIHAFKGRVGMLGMLGLHKRIANLEAMLKRGEPVDAELKQAQESIDEFCAAIRHALRRPSALSGGGRKAVEG